MIPSVPRAFNFREDNKVKSRCRQAYLDADGTGFFKISVRSYFSTAVKIQVSGSSVRTHCLEAALPSS